MAEGTPTKVALVLVELADDTPETREKFVSGISSGFKVPEAKAREILKALPFTLSKSCTLDEARKLAEKVQQIGGVCRMKTLEEIAQEPKPAPPAAPAAPDAPPPAAPKPAATVSGAASSAANPRGEETAEAADVPLIPLAVSVPGVKQGVRAAAKPSPAGKPGPGAKVAVAGIPAPGQVKCSECGTVQPDIHRVCQNCSYPLAARSPAKKSRPEGAPRPSARPAPAGRPGRKGGGGLSASPVLLFLGAGLLVVAGIVGWFAWTRYFSRPTGPDPQALAAEGEILAGEQKYGLALEKFRQAIAATPQEGNEIFLAGLHKSLGLAHKGQGDTQAALAHLQASLRLHEANASTHKAVAEILFDDPAMREECRRELVRAQELDPTDASIAKEIELLDNLVKASGAAATPAPSGPSGPAKPAGGRQRKK